MVASSLRAFWMHLFIIQTPSFVSLFVIILSLCGSPPFLSQVWNTSTCEFVRTLNGHKRGIACLQYRDRLVVSGSSDNTIRWETHSPLQVLCKHTVSGALGRAEVRQLKCSVPLSTLKYAFFSIEHWELLERDIRSLFYCVVFHPLHLKSPILINKLHLLWQFWCMKELASTAFYDVLSWYFNWTMCLVKGVRFAVRGI